MKTERLDIDSNAKTRQIQIANDAGTEQVSVAHNVFLPSMIGADSHTGLVRSDNQDSFAYALSQDGTMAFLLVADGIGGNEGGDLASRFVAENMLREFLLFQKNGTATTDQTLEFLRSRITLTNSALRTMNENYNILHPMGTTIAALVMLPDHVVAAHAGDSRIYCLRQGLLKPYTRDHSVVNDMLRRGEITPEQAAVHPMAHVISQSMGVMSEVKPDFSVFDLQPGDRFLVCSDGLLLHLAENSIRNIMIASKTAKDAVRNLITLALRGGGGDNTTAVCAFFSR